MNEQELEQYLYKHIPLSLMMQVSAVAVKSDSILLRAPLEPNINHTHTVFGGSAASVAILSAWSLVYMYMKNAGLDCSIVIQRNTMAYKKPISGGFKARSEFKQPELLALFIKTFLRHGKARVSVNAVLEYEGASAGAFEGDFVVTKVDKL
jgi:thioesterase domain-containing protein